MVTMSLFSLLTGIAAASADVRVPHDVKLTILQTTDLHHHANGAGHLGLDVDSNTARSVVGSYARIASYVNYVRATAGNQVLLVDSGDWTMGTFYDLTLGSEPLALGFISLMRYDCITFGNHEFDYTTKGLAQMLTAAQSKFRFHTPIVASNLNLNGDPNLTPLVGDGNLIRSTFVEQLPNGLKIGYIGLMGRNAAIDTPGAAPVTFTNPSTAYASIQALVDGLRNAAGADVVIALSHSGTNASGASGEDIDLARHVSGIDVIASGHTHTPLSTSHPVTNGAWTTQVVNSGAYGSNVTRVDLTYHRATHSTSLDAASNPSMTDATLQALDPSLGPDLLTTLIVGLVDRQLNSQLAPFFSRTFPDYDAANVGTGLYHVVGTATQNMVSNGSDPVPAPNGLGDLAADSLRSVPNSIILETLNSIGGDPTSFPGYDFTPFQAAVTATGVLRGKLLSGVPLSFADIYNVLPLGISPDTTQSLPVGFPLISAYLDVGDVAKLCGLQLAIQSKLATADFYLNISGIQCNLGGAGSYAYFKYATAASVLQLTSQKALGGSLAAAQALGALHTLGSDGGAALLASYAGGNVYAAAMVRLNDGAPAPVQIAANLGALGQVAFAAAVDQATGSRTLVALVIGKAIGAVDSMGGYAASDAANVGPTSLLTGPTRVRIATDLYAVLFIGAAHSEFGITVTPYQGPTGAAALSAANFGGILANRINAAPASGTVQELKEWMALLSYESVGLGSTIGPTYASTGNFTQFGSFGTAVQNRSASYPIANLGQLFGTVAALQSAP